MNKPMYYKYTLILVVGVTLISLVGVSFRVSLNGIGQSALAHMYHSPSADFPSIDSAKLTKQQIKIIASSRQEYAKKPVSFDANVLKYTQGSKESWCADYVSWVLKQTGQPLSNPNSGSWRIPGTATMQQYFELRKQYHAAGSYTPKVGDVAIYRHNRSHVNLVIAVNSTSMTTIGGNETGHLRLNQQSFSYGSEGLSGFGSP